MTFLLTYSLLDQFNVYLYLFIVKCDFLMCILKKIVMFGEH